MSRRPFLVLHKSKWESLQKQAGQIKTDEEATPFHKKREYYDALDEQSKAWKKNWPDTIEGCLAKVEARKQREFKRNKAFIKAFEEQQRQRSTGKDQAVADAKKELFRTSNYGQQLTSAIRESKVIEERNAQIEMKKFIKQKDEEYDEYVTAKIASIENNHFDLAKKDDERVRKTKLLQIEQAEINKMIHRYKVQEIAKAKEQETLEGLEDERLQKMNLEFEKHEMDHCKEKAKEESKQYEADCKVIREEKLKRAQEDDALVAVWAKHYDTVRCKERKTWEKVIKDRGQSENYKKAFKMVEDALENRKKAYETFVDKRIQKLEQGQTNAEENVLKDKHLKDENYRKQIFEDYKTALDVKEILKHCNKCYCEKQSLFTKPEKKVKGAERDPYKPESFLTPYTRLSEDLNKRKHLPPGGTYTAASGQHDYFAEQAAAAIAECKHKRLIRKVIDDYKKTNNLEATTFPILDC